ncbi:hypothetical protein chiPu_0017598 [Chiloscyllium punctatum]|uniref:Uncharacterized protein n=1 Tax=Chiloscyllium punctatum TaxID=137246 RepID=A0A401RHE6_CHIPU|nr:hypothetical protein [Chiloscyllium punctatum]
MAEQKPTYRCTVYCMSELELCHASWSLLREHELKTRRQEEAPFTHPRDLLQHRDRANSPGPGDREHVSPKIRNDSPSTSPTLSGRNHALQHVKDIFF